MTSLRAGITAFPKLLLASAMAAAAACDSTTLPTTAPPVAIAKKTDAAGDGLTIMTYNIYQGTELQNSLAATTVDQFVVGVAQDFAMMHQTNFGQRAQAIAAEIDAAQPDLVGLQEVALWRTAPTQTPSVPATTVDQDFLQILLTVLAARGDQYVVVSKVSNFDVQGPGLFPSGFMDVRLTDQNVILARTNGADAVAVFNPQSSNYARNLFVQTLGGPVEVKEGWASIDVQRRGGAVRFITTHLDAFDPVIRLAQANEVLTGPANTTMPVVLAGDLNSSPTADSYASLQRGGFADVWAALRPNDDGFTCCQLLPTIDNTRSLLSERIDYVLSKGAINGVSITQLGVNPSARTMSGLWPSDHGALLARFELPGSTD